MKKNGHGGKRVGAGRKAGTRIIPPENIRKTFGTRLPGHMIDWLKSESNRQDIHCSTLLENIIEYYKNAYS